MNARSGLRLVTASAFSVASALLVVSAAGGLIAVSALPAAAAEPAVPAGCSVDTFVNAAIPDIKVTLCPAPVKPGSSTTESVAVSETIESGGQSFVRNSQLDFFDGETTSRSIDDISLAKVGIAKSLHITIDFKAGAVHLEHALLVPGAIALK